MKLRLIFLSSIRDLIAHDNYRQQIRCMIPPLNISLLSKTSMRKYALQMRIYDNTPNWGVVQSPYKEIDNPTSPKHK